MFLLLKKVVDAPELSNPVMSRERSVTNWRIFGFSLTVVQVVPKPLNLKSDSHRRTLYDAPVEEYFLTLPK